MISIVSFMNKAHILKTHHVIFHYVACGNLNLTTIQGEQVCSSAKAFSIRSQESREYSRGKWPNNFTSVINNLRAWVGNTNREL